MGLFDKRFVYLEWDDVLQGKEVFRADTFPELKRRVEADDARFKGIVEKNNGDYPFLHKGAVVYTFVYYDPNYECKLAYAQGKMIQYRNKDSSDPWKDCAEEPYWTEACEYRVKPNEGKDSCKLILNDNNEACIVKEGREWKGFLIKKGTEEECKDYAVKNYCEKCVHEVSICCSPRLGCQGFKPKKKRRMTNRELAKWLADDNGQVEYSSSGFKCTEHSYIDNDDAPASSNVLIRGWDETEWHKPEVED